MRHLKRKISIQQIVEYYVATNGTMRAVAKDFGISKTAVHVRITKFLNSNHKTKKDIELAENVRKIIELNKQERAIRGGQSTKEIYLSLK